jgi:hypothetical protein
MMTTSDRQVRQPRRWLMCSTTGEVLRYATPEECDESDKAWVADGGYGHIDVGGRTCYVDW